MMKLIIGHMTKGPDTRAIEIQKNGGRHWLRIEGAQNVWVDFGEIARRAIENILERFKSNGWAVAVEM